MTNRGNRVRSYVDNFETKKRPTSERRHERDDARPTDAQSAAAAWRAGEREAVAEWCRIYEPADQDSGPADCSRVAKVALELGMYTLGQTIEEEQASQGVALLRMMDFLRHMAGDTDA